MGAANPPHIRRTRRAHLAPNQSRLPRRAKETSGSNSRLNPYRSIMCCSSEIASSFCELSSPSYSRRIKFGLVRRSAGKPSQQFTSRFRRNWRSLHLFSDWIDKPHPWLLSKLRAKPETILPAAQSCRIIRGAAECHLRSGAGPFLVSQLWSAQPDGIVKACDETIRVGNEINRRTLMRYKFLSIHLKFVLLRLASKNWMILQNEARFVRSRLAAVQFAWRRRAPRPSPLIPPPTTTQSYVSPVSMVSAGNGS